MWQVQGGYRLSLFNNDIESMTFNNPLFATPTLAGFNSNVGQMPLAPNNQAHNLFLNGGLNLPMATRLTAKVALGMNRQDDNFFPHTVNSLLVGDPRLVLYSPSLRGDVRTYLANVTGTTRPIQDLSVTGAYRYYAVDNRTLHQTFPGHVVRDTGAVVGETRFSHVHDYTKHNADLDAAYKLFRPLTLRAGFGWERWDRSETQETGLSDEYSGKFGLDYRPLSWLDIKGRYVRSWRRIDFYNTFSHLAHTVLEEELPGEAAVSQSPLARKFTMAARDRHKAEITFHLMPIETLDVGITLAYAQDRFPWSYLGLQDDKNWSGALDVGYTPVPWLTLRANVAREENHAKQRSEFRTVVGGVTTNNPRDDWISRNVDTYDTVGAGTIFRLIPDKLDLQADYGYYRSIARVNSFNTQPPPASGAFAAAASFPDDRFSLHRIGGVLRYWLLKNLTVRLGYTYERFRVSYWQTDFIQPVNRNTFLVPPTPFGQTDVFLGAKPFKNYETHIIGGGITYGF